ncbi:MAG TPA: hypothetical protein VFJ30_13490 [Phycisphaerae bacterium]|nr:hypothetical protein [Phycisphaerae bacterium]
MAMLDNHSGRGPLGGPGRCLAVLALTLVAGALAGQLLLAPRAAEAQSGSAAAPASASGILAVPAQISRDQFGLFLVDAREGTMSLYGYESRDRVLQLLASRTFIYDLQLDSYNTKPLPKDVQKMAADARRLKSAEPKP